MSKESRVNAYTRPDAKGGVIVDVQGMARDLVMVLKWNMMPKEEFTALMDQMWDDVHVERVQPAGTTTRRVQ
jgi:hypothetical protein